MARAPFPRKTSDVGTFYTSCKVENVVNRSQSAIIRRLLVDSGNEYSWIPTAALERIGVNREKKDVPFVMANGQQISRSVGFVIIRLVSTCVWIPTLRNSWPPDPFLPQVD